MGKRALIQQKRNRQKSTQVIMAVIGFFLIAASIAIFFILSKPGQAGADTQASASRSTVPVEVNMPAPTLSLENINGNVEALTDYRDKIVLVNNWATWCPPCKAEMPTLVEYYQAHAGEGFVIVSIDAGESKQTVQKFAEQYGMTFPVWLDPQGAAMDAFKNQSLPSSYVIDRTGTIRVMWVGEINRAMLEKYVTPVITGN